MTRLFFSLAVGTLWTALLFSSAQAEEVPAQFKAWGRQAIDNKALPDAGLDQDSSEAPKAGADEVKRGFFVFSRPCSDHVTPEILPMLETADRCQGLAAADCRGQYGPLSFCVVALKKGDFTATVSDLQGPGGEKIPAANFDVRAVRYALLTDRQKKEVVSPIVLEAFEKKTIAGNRMQQFWITYHIPEKAAPGTYEGAITVAGHGNKVIIPLKITVYPFALGANPTNAYIYCHTGPQSPELLARQFSDQKLHGMTMSMITVPVTRPGELIKDKLVELLDIYVQAGFDREIHMQVGNRVTGEWLWEPDKSIGMWGPWSRHYPLSEALDKRFNDIARTLDEEATKRKLKLVLTVSDETGAHAWTIKGAQHYFQLVKDKLPHVTRELTVGGGWAMRVPEHEIWKGLIHVWTTNRWLPDKIEIVRKDDPNAQIQLYNMGGPGSGPGGTGSSPICTGSLRGRPRRLGWRSGCTAIMIPTAMSGRRRRRTAAPCRQCTGRRSVREPRIGNTLQRSKRRSRARAARRSSRPGRC
jgi:Glycoside hydrolase 123 N-terminal domain